MSGKMNSEGHESKDAPEGDPFHVEKLSTAKYAKSLDGAKGAAEVGEKPKCSYEPKGG